MRAWRDQHGWQGDEHGIDAGELWDDRARGSECKIAIISIELWKWQYSAGSPQLHPSGQKRCCLTQTVALHSDQEFYRGQFRPFQT